MKPTTTAMLNLEEDDTSRGKQQNNNWKQVTPKEKEGNFPNFPLS